jgi:hypothetical protein
MDSKSRYTDVIITPLCAFHNVPNTKRDMTGVDLDFIRTVFIESVHFLLLGAGEAREANT